MENSDSVRAMPNKQIGVKLNGSLLRAHARAADSALALCRYLTISCVSGPNHAGDRVGSDVNHTKQLIFGDDSQSSVSQQIRLLFHSNTSDGIVSRLDDVLLQRIMDASPAKYMLTYHPDPTTLILAAEEIRFQYWDLFVFRFQRCWDNVQLALDMPDYQCLAKRAVLKKDCCGGWVCVMEVKSPCTTALGCLIITKPCGPTCIDRNIDKDKHADTSRDHSMYFSEMAAASLLLTKRLFGNTSAVDMWYKERTISVLVVNMTPTQVRVIEAIVRNPLEPTIEYILRDVIDHDIEKPEHWASREPYKFRTCPGCRKVLSWLLFVRPGVDLKQPPSARKSDSSQGNGVTSGFGGPGSAAVSVETNVTVPSEPGWVMVGVDEEVGGMEVDEEVGDME